MLERFKFSPILLAVMLMILPLTGYTMSYESGYVDGVESQQLIMQTKIDTLSTRMGEMEADLYRDRIVDGVESNDSETIELSEIRLSEEGTGNGGIIVDRYKNPEVGWRGIF